MGLFKDICEKFGMDGEMEQKAEAFVKEQLFGDEASDKEPQTADRQDDGAGYTTPAYDAEGNEQNWGQNGQQASADQDDDQ